MLDDYNNNLILHLEISAYTAYTGYKGHVFKRLYTCYTAYLHKSTNWHTPMIKSAAKSLFCASQNTWVNCVHFLQEKIEKATFFKVYVNLHNVTSRQNHILNDLKTRPLLFPFVPSVCIVRRDFKVHPRFLRYTT